MYVVDDTPSRDFRMRLIRFVRMWHRQNTIVRQKPLYAY